MYHYYIQITRWIITRKSVKIIKKSTPAAPCWRRWLRWRPQQALMLNIACSFTWKSLGVAVVVSDFKLEVSWEGFNSIESSNRGSQQPTGEVFDDDNDCYDDANKVRWWCNDGGWYGRTLTIVYFAIEDRVKMKLRCVYDRWKCLAVQIFDIQWRLQWNNKRQQECGKGDNDGQHETEEEITINPLTGSNVSYLLSLLMKRSFLCYKFSYASSSLSLSPRFWNVSGSPSSLSILSLSSPSLSSCSPFNG